MGESRGREGFPYPLKFPSTVTLLDFTLNVFVASSSAVNRNNLSLAVWHFSICHCCAGYPDSGLTLFRAPLLDKMQCGVCLAVSSCKLEKPYKKEIPAKADSQLQGFFIYTIERMDISFKIAFAVSRLRMQIYL